MSGGGHMALLAKRMKENEARRRVLRQNKRHNASKIKGANLEINQFDFVELSDQELKEVKQKYVEKLQRERNKQLVKVSFITLFIIIILISLYYVL